MQEGEGRIALASSFHVPYPHLDYTFQEAVGTFQVHHTALYITVSGTIMFVFDSGSLIYSYYINYSEWLASTDGLLPRRLCHKYRLRHRSRLK
jgi:hypothetical protein